MSGREPVRAILRQGMARTGRVPRTLTAVRRAMDLCDDFPDRPD
jgi:hypothetical protein